MEDTHYRMNAVLFGMDLALFGMLVCLEVWVRFRRVRYAADRGKLFMVEVFRG